MFEVNLRHSPVTPLKNAISKDQKVDFACDYIFRVDRETLENWVKVVYFNEDDPVGTMSQIISNVQSQIPDDYLLMQGARARAALGEGIKAIEEMIKMLLVEFQE